jgi:hypothetical protein
LLPYSGFVTSPLKLRAAEVYSANDRFRRRIRGDGGLIGVPWLMIAYHQALHKELEDVGSTEHLRRLVARAAPDADGAHGRYLRRTRQSRAATFDALDTAMGKRAEPLMIIISTGAPRRSATISAH